MPASATFAVLSVFLSLRAAAASADAPADPSAVPVALPGGGEGIGFDDLGFAPSLAKVLVPGGRTGKLFLVDPATRKVSALGGFTEGKAYKGGHGEGVTSADEGAGLLFGSDRNAVAVVAVDPKTRKTVARAALGGNPDYVRYAAPTREVWVSEPSAQRIEVFAWSSDGKTSALKQAGVIPVPGGPESLVIDAARGRAYTHTWKDETFAIDLKSRAVAARWKNGCVGSRGIALDPKTGWVFAGCEEGKAVVLDAARDGAVLSSLESGKGVDVIAYDAARRRLYLPGADSATMAVLAVSDDGKLSLLRAVKTAEEAHCAAADSSGGVWVCDPHRGRLLFFRDR